MRLDIADAVKLIVDTLAAPPNGRNGSVCEFGTVAGADISNCGQRDASPRGAGDQTFSLEAA
jgi:hypothetical protein